VGAVDKPPGYHVMCLDLGARERIGHG